MRRSRARFSRSDASCRTLWSAACITNFIALLGSTAAWPLAARAQWPVRPVIEAGERKRSDAASAQAGGSKR
jgi:hypothetical protein